MEVLEFYDLIESKRMARLEQLVQKQKSIESPLIKVRPCHTSLEDSSHAAIRPVRRGMVVLTCPLLCSVLSCQVEELVAGSNSGCSPVLAGYYQFWEKKMYNAIAKMTITSLASLIVILQVGLPSTRHCTPACWGVSDLLCVLSMCLCRASTWGPSVGCAWRSTARTSSSTRPSTTSTST